MKIVILSRNPKLYSTQRLVEAAEKRKHEVLVVDHLKCNIEIEKKSPKKPTLSHNMDHPHRKQDRACGSQSQIRHQLLRHHNRELESLSMQPYHAYS